MTLCGEDWLDHFTSNVREFFGEEEIVLIKRHYGFDQISIGTGNVHSGLLEFVSDVRFYMPLVNAVNFAPSGVDVRIYHLHEVRSI